MNRLFSGRVIIFGMAYYWLGYTTHDGYTYFSGPCPHVTTIINL